MFDSKEYYIKNKERIKNYHIKWQINNPKKCREYSKKYREKNPEYYEKHKEEIKKNSQLLKNIKYKTNPKFNINDKMKRAINISLKGNKNGRHWETLIGYTCNDLIKRLKKTMPQGYTWQDFMKGELHIDHKIPKSVFNFTKPEHIDFKRCWALENLQLLPARENLIKQDKLSKPFQPALAI